MSASGRFHDFAVENCHPRVLIIWLNVSAAKYKVRRWTNLFLFQGEKYKKKMKTKICALSHSGQDKFHNSHSDGSLETTMWR